MDPALAELLEGDGADEIPVLLRLEHAGDAPVGVRVVAQLGPIASCRLQRGAIVPIREDPRVASMKAGRILQHEVGWADPEPVPTDTPEPPHEALPGDDRRGAALEYTGRGVALGVIDWGADVCHPDFRHPDGTTRLRALWDQGHRYDPARPNPYGYGLIHHAADIDAALQTADPYAALEYHPGDSDPSGTGAHGTHVLGIAAGNGAAGGPLGVAPEADLVFVHLANIAGDGPDALGDSVSLLEAIDFIARVAGDQPWVINLSMGRHCGPHDGTTLIEQALDAVVTARPGRAICQSAGNYFGARVHTEGQLRPGGTRTISVTIAPEGSMVREVELWYSGRDRMVIAVDPPAGAGSGPVPLGDHATILSGGDRIARVYHRANDPNNRDNHIEVFIYPGAPSGSWRITLTGDDVVDGRFHAWIERSSSRLRQSRFGEQDAVDNTTTGTICNGYRTIAVGAYDAATPDRRLAAFSSKGPTRIGVVKPDLVAPGVHILAARSAPRVRAEQLELVGASAAESADPEPPAEPPRRHRMLTRLSGTSMASPCTAGAVALMFEAAGRPLAIEETRRLLLSTAEPSRAGTPDAAVGSGYLSIERAVAAAAALRPTPAVQVREEVHVASSDSAPELEAAASTEVSPGEAIESPFPSCSEGEGAEQAEFVAVLIDDAHEATPCVGCGDHEGESVAEAATAIDAGTTVLERIPLLRTHKGTPPDLVLRWTPIPAEATAIDVVVHLHGHSGHGIRMNIEHDKLPASGLDFATPGRPRPSLGILPRGNYTGTNHGMGYNFAALVEHGALQALIDFSLDQLAERSGRHLSVERLVLTAHSGGGASLLRILGHTDPLEIHIFDAFYQSPAPLVEWAVRRIARDRAARAGQPAEGARRYQLTAGGALRVLFTPYEKTAAFYRGTHEALCSALGGDAALARWYRVEQAKVGHNDIPATYGGPLLADAGVDLGRVITASCDGHRPPGSGHAGGEHPTPTPTPTPTEPAPITDLFGPSEAKALRVTNAFEDTTTFVRHHDLGYGALTGDFDAMGLSFGLLQWNIGSDSLQPLLKRYARQNPADFDRAFGEGAAELRDVLARSRDEQLAWARSINDAKHHIVPVWSARFERLSEDPGFRALQLREVRPRMDAALKFTRLFGLETERSLSFMFDVVTGHGAGWLDSTHCRGCRDRTRRARIGELLGGTLHGATEADTLRAVTQVLHDTVVPKWAEDVRKRRATIIEGRGRVHGFDFDLARDFGLGDGPMQLKRGAVPAPSPTPVHPPAPAPPTRPLPPLPAGGLVYSPDSHYTPVAGTFRCHPKPLAVDAATLFPVPSIDSDGAARTALAAAGVGSDALTRFEHGGGIAALRPIAATFGAPALGELLRRLRYSAHDLVAPPATRLPSKLGVPGVGACLAPRLLLAVPGHFRELARRAPTAREAHALEVVGWLGMHLVRDAIAQSTGVTWWVPPVPAFVAPLPAAAPDVRGEVLELIAVVFGGARGGAIEAYNRAFETWRAGLPGHLWRAETGADPAAPGPGRPLYAQLLAVPPAPSVSRERATIQAAWTRHVADVSQQHQPETAEWAKALTHTCHLDLLRDAATLESASLGGLELVEDFPARVDRGRSPALTSLPVLAPARPLFEAVFTAAAQLGWNDLLFQTSGTACFRGVKLGEKTLKTDPHRYYRAAGHLSNHGYALAIDCNAHENAQRVEPRIDPRLVALFEAHHFRWLQCASVPDPMHFEYVG